MSRDNPAEFQVVDRNKIKTAALILIPVVTILFWRLLRDMIFLGMSPDFSWHDEFIQAIRGGNLRTIPHFLYHLLVLAVQLPLEKMGLVHHEDYRGADFAVAMCSIIATAELAFLVLCRSTRLRAGAAVTLSALLAIGLLLIHPLPLLVFRDGRRYLGYLAPNTFHNPTMLLVKPLAILNFLSVMRAFRKEAVTAGQIGGCIVLTILSAMAKPSFLLALLPAAALIALIRMLRGEPVQWRMLAGGIFAPALAMAFFQYWITYGSAVGNGNHIVFAPLAAMRGVSHFLGAKFVLSILFPAAVFLLYIDRARKDLRLGTAWTVFLISLPFAYLLAESERVIHGNFVWTAHLALFLLFLESTTFVLRQSDLPEDRIKLATIALLFLMHVAAGIYYQTYMMRTKEAHPEALPVFAMQLRLNPQQSWG